MQQRFLTIGAVSTCLCAAIGLSAQATIVFDSDFTTGDPLPDASGNRDFTPSLADLNAGTDVGAWSFDTGADAGTLNEGSGGSTRSLAFDQGEGDVEVLTGTFSSASAIGSGNTVTYSWNWVNARSGPNKNIVFSALSGGTAAYQLSWSQTSGILSWVDTGGGLNEIVNLTLVDYLYLPNFVRDTSEELSLELLVTDGTGATLSLDTNNDGDFTDLDDIVTVIGARNAGLTSLDALSFSFDGTGSPKGQHIADVTVESIIPEPSSMALLFAGGASMLWRRRAGR